MKQRTNRCSCKDHDKIGLIPSDPCNCHLAYLYPLDEKNDGRRWIKNIHLGSKDVQTALT